MFNTQIQLGSLGYLDISENVPMPLNFGIAEIRDISKRRGAFSKTIEVAGTANNNELLGYLFDVNVSDSSFNINLKQECTILQNGVPVMEGYLQLVSVNKLAPSSFGLDEQVTYSVLVKDGSADFYSTMQEKRLEDLTGFTQYNHIYTLSSITATSAFTVDNDYTYILPFKASPFYILQDFTPAIYAKKYWDEIFQQNGYTYTWDSLTGCSFDKLVIPYNGDSAGIKLDNIAYVRIGFSGASDDISVTATSTSIQPYVNLIKYDDEITPPNTNPNGYYVASPTYDYQSDYFGNVEINIKYNYRITLDVPVNTIFKQSVGSTINPFLRIKVDNTINNTQNSYLNVTNNLLDANIVGGGGDSEVSISAGTYTFDFNTDVLSAVMVLQDGDTVSAFISGLVQTGGIWFDGTGVSPLTGSNVPTVTVSTRIDPTNSNNNYFTVIPSQLSEGQLVEVEDFIPKKIKQKDFIKGVSLLYNLFFTPDPDTDNNIIIQTRDEYYDSGSIVDWTDKLNVGNDIRIDFLPDLQDKRLTLTYKQDKDVWNTQYELGTGEVYGQVEYTFENEFTQSNKKIETIFSPTPIIINANKLVVPAINTNNPKNNIRILYYDGWKNGIWKFGKPTPLNPSGNTFTFDSYPRALHYDDPINPTIDINFALPDYLFYSGYETVTNNNLYNRYWSRYINQIETGKLMTATFYLNEADIQSLDLRSKIWVHDAYWNINRIIDYNGNGNGLTKVELISVDEGLKFEPTEFNIDSLDSPIRPQGSTHNWVTNWASILEGQSKNLFAAGVVNTSVLGQDNLIQGGTDSSIILGNNNNYNGANGILVGDDNNVQGNNLFVFGGSGLTITGDSQAIFNVPVSATTINVTELFIDGSTAPIEPSVWEAGTGTDGIQQILGIGANDASGQSSLASGLNTTASGLAALSSGEATVASGDGSIASGFGSEAIGLFSMATGRFTKAEIDGEVASNGNATSTAGDSQFGTVNSIVTTTNATPTTLDFNSLGVAIGGYQIPVAAVMSFRYQVTCFNASTNDSRLISGEGLVKNDGIGHVLVFASTPSNNGDAGLAAVLAAPLITTGLVFQVTGIAATTLVWSVRMDYSLNT